MSEASARWRMFFLGPVALSGGEVYLADAVVGSLKVRIMVRKSACK